MKLLVINGPNLNMLGIREPLIYGKENYNYLVEQTQKTCDENGVTVKIYQSNHEGEIIDEIQSAYKVYDAIIINPAAYTHTSVAILDAIKAVGLPAIEVHISDPDKREDFRKKSYIREACIATVKGEGIAGYTTAILKMKKHIEDRG